MIRPIVCSWQRRFCKTNHRGIPQQIVRLMYPKDVLFPDEGLYCKNRGHNYWIVAYSISLPSKRELSRYKRKDRDGINVPT